MRDAENLVGGWGFRDGGGVERERGRVVVTKVSTIMNMGMSL